MMTHLENNISVMSGEDNSADIVEILPKEDRFEVKQNLNTDKKEVYAACLIYGGQHGISPVPEPHEVPESQTLILGCNEGNVFKFER